MDVAVSAAPLWSRAARAAGALRRRPRLLPGSVRSRLVAVVVLVLIAAASGTQLVIDRVNALPGDAVFRVGGTVVTEAQLQRRIDLMVGLYGLRRPTDPQQVDKFNRDTAKAVAVSDILDNAARADGIVIADKTASDQLATMISQKYQNNRDAFLQVLGSKGLSEQDVLDELKRQLASGQLFAKVTGTVKAATDDDAHAYYTQNQAQMVSPEQRQISNIVVSSQQQAEQIAQQAKSGSDFAALAKASSLDQSTKDNGGDLGAVSADQLDSGYATAAFQAPADSVFGPVQTQQGWNVGRIVKVQPAVPLSFDQLKDTIKTKLDNDAKFKVWQDWLVGQIKSAGVVYAGAYRPADPDAPPGNQ